MDPKDFTRSSSRKRRSTSGTGPPMTAARRRIFLLGSNWVPLISSRENFEPLDQTVLFHGNPTCLCLAANPSSSTLHLPRSRPRLQFGSTRSRLHSLFATHWAASSSAVVAGPSAVELSMKSRKRSWWDWRVCTKLSDPPDAPLSL